MASASRPGHSGPDAAAPRSRSPRARPRRPRAAPAPACPIDERARDVGAVAAGLGAEVEEQKIARLDRAALDERACGSAERGPDATIDGNGNPSLPSSRSAFSSTPATCKLRHPDAHLRQRPLERARRDAVRRLDERELARHPFARAASRRGRPSAATASARPPRADAESRGAADAPTRSRRPRAYAELRELLPETGPQTLRLDDDARERRRPRRRSASDSGNR